MSLMTSLCNERVDQLHLTDPVTVPSGTSLRDVIETMKNARHGAVLICKGKTFHGLFTERDLVDHVLGDEMNLDEPIDKFLVEVPRIVRPGDHVGDTLELMASHGLRHVPVCDDNDEVVGVLSVRNIIDCLAEHYPTEVINQPPRADQNMTAQEGG